MNADLVVMGVAGNGKSSLAAAFTSAESLTLIEGDAFHSADSIDKMSRGIALTDADRAGWLDHLGVELQAHTRGVVLTCSALHRAYRERLRAASPGLVTIGVMAMAMYELFSWVEKRTTGWAHRGSQAG